MASETALELADSLVYTATGRHLSDLQYTIVQQVWQGRTYPDIARRVGYTEGHIKDVASHLWKSLSQALGEKVTKASLKSALQRRLRDAVSSRAKEISTSKRAAHQRSASERSASERLANQPPQPRTLSEDQTLLGRTAALTTLDQLAAQGPHAIVIQGEGGLGKTTLAQHYLSSRPFDRVLELQMAKETADITPVERVVEEWLKQDFGAEPGREFGVTLGRLKRQLHRHRVGVLIDNLEPALDAMGRFLPAHSRYRELLRALTDYRSRALTLLTSRDRLCEPGIPVVHYRLPGLDCGAWSAFLTQRGVRVDGAALNAMHTAYGGNAKAMEILCGMIQEDFGGDMAAYWDEVGRDLLCPIDLQNLVDSQVCHLKALDPDAYRVYCRLGVYRYQRVPAVPAQAVFKLMGELPPERHRSILTSLRNRSLVECDRGSYWLHPVVRADAIARLRETGDWVSANRHAAAFWTESVSRITTIDDAIQALEAYYHFVAIGDYVSAGRVLLHSRDNQWRQFLPLGSTLYRMGLIQPVVEAITIIIDHISSNNSDASELYNILGDLYWITGRIAKAIACQQNTRTTAQRCLEQTPDEPSNKRRRHYLMMLAVDAELSLGLYHLDLWDLDAAATLFQTVIDQSAHTDHHRWAEKATVCLALAQAYRGHAAEALTLADSVYPVVMASQQTGRQAFFAQILGHTYCTLGKYDQANALLQAAIEAAQMGHYIQVEANARVGLGKLGRLQGNQTDAIATLEQAIAHLDNLGAKCDLAEAHYQLGLTYQGIDENRRDYHLSQAAQLFMDIQAPKQVEKVRQASILRSGS